jgi:hypothetical protein
MKNPQHENPGPEDKQRLVPVAHQPPAQILKSNIQILNV